MLYGKTYQPICWNCQKPLTRAPGQDFATAELVAYVCNDCEEISWTTVRELVAHLEKSAPIHR